MARTTLGTATLGASGLYKVPDDYEEISRKCWRVPADYKPGDDDPLQPGDVLEHVLYQDVAPPIDDGATGIWFNCRSSEVIWKTGDEPKTAPSNLAALERCEDPDKIGCRKSRRLHFGLENTGKNFNFFYTGKLLLSNGASVPVTLPAASGNTPQLVAWQAVVEAALATVQGSENCVVGARCRRKAPQDPKVGCGGLPGEPADVDMGPSMFYRYLHVSCCYGEVIPVGFELTATDHPAGVEKLGPFITSFAEGREQRYEVCIWCDGRAPLWRQFDPEANDGAGGLVLAPAADIPPEGCWLDCAETWPDPPTVPCTHEPIDGYDCQWPIVDGAPDYDAVPTQTPVVGIYSFCEDGTLKTQYFTEDAENDALVPYTLLGIFGDENCEEIKPPVLPCPPGLEWECLTYQNHAHIWDNSSYTNAPAAHLPNGDGFTLEVEQADGTTTDIVFPAGSSYFFPAKALIEAAFPGCVVKFVCANFPKCRPQHAVPWGLTPDISVLWAMGWWVECCSGVSPFIRATVKDADDAAWNGAYKDLKTYEGPATKVYRAVDCGISYWKDCDQQDIAKPPCDCLEPCDRTAEILEKVLAECTTAIPGADYSGAIQVTVGRPGNQAFDLLTSDGTLVAHGDTYQEFSAAMKALGYLDFTAGPTREAHHFCPCPPGLDAPGDYVLHVDGKPQSKLECIPLAKIENGPEKVLIEALCALRTVGCNDTRRDDLLAELLACLQVLKDLIVECQPEGCISARVRPDAVAPYYNGGTWQDLTVDPGVVGGDLLAFPVKLGPAWATANRRTGHAEYSFPAATGIPPHAVIKRIKAFIVYQGIADSNPGDDAEFTASLTVRDGTTDYGLPGYSTDTAGSYWGDQVQVAGGPFGQGQNDWAGGLFGTLDNAASGLPDRTICLVAPSPLDPSGAPLTAAALTDMVLPIWHQRWQSNTGGTPMEAILHDIYLEIEFDLSSCPPEQGMLTHLSQCSIQGIAAAFASALMNQPAAGGAGGDDCPDSDKLTAYLNS